MNESTSNKRSMDEQPPNVEVPQKKKSGNIRCIHDKEKRRCAECGGSDICSHGIYKAICKDCAGSQLCTHESTMYMSI
jgi:hypothetical protein